eukprot:Clim_evm60s203 gene=Clim_evmTU60s203
MVTKARNKGEVVWEFPDYTLRRYKDGDQEGVVKLISKVLEAFDISLSPQSTDADLFDTDGVVLNQGGDFWVLVNKESDEIVGSGSWLPCHDRPGCVEIRKMYIHSSCRGKRLGVKVLKLLEEAAAREGYKSGRLDTNSKLKVARAMYMRYGWTDWPYEIGNAPSRCDVVLYKEQLGTHFDNVEL